MNLSAWRSAARLARRDVRRRPARTVLVAALVFVPVAAMTLADIYFRTDGAQDGFDRRWGIGVDLVVDQDLGGAVDLAPASPDDAVVAVQRVVWAPIQTAGDDIVADVTLRDAFAEGTATLTAGAFAAEVGEVWVSEPLLAELGIGVGDLLELRHPHGAWTVVGAGKVADDFASYAVQMPDLPVEQFHDGQVRHATLIEFGAGATPGETYQVAVALDEAARGGSVAGRDALVDIDSVVWEYDSSPVVLELEHVRLRDGWGWDRPVGERAALAWGWVFGVIALAAVGIVIAAAFATSARRQLVTIGQLSANGASESTIRRTMALQGLWTGAIGSVAGVVAAIVTMVLGHSALESLHARSFAPTQIAWAEMAVIAATGIAAATVAALVPARSASRIPVLAALAGRRPLGSVPRRLAPIGIGLFAFGTFLLVVAAVGGRGSGGGDATTAAAVAGGVLVLAGCCCASPAATEAMAAVGARAGRSWRLAGRSLARTRTRSAAITTAIAVTAGVAVAASAFVASALEPDVEHHGELPLDAIVLRSHPAETLEEIGPDRFEYRVEPRTAWVPSDEMRDAITEVVPGATWYPRRIAAWTPPPRIDGRGSWEDDDPSRGLHVDTWQTIVIADEPAMDLYELSASERDALAAAGAMSLAPWRQVEGGVLVFATDDGDVEVPFVLREAVEERLAERDEERLTIAGRDVLTSWNEILITEDAAVTAGFEVVDSGAIVRSAGPLTASQRNAVWTAVHGTTFGADLGHYYVAAPAPPAFVEGFSVGMEYPPREPSSAAMQAISVAIALVLVLLVVAIGLSLAAAEGRDERDVLVAVGARTDTIRAMAGAKAVVLTLTGIALGLPTGLIPVRVVAAAVEHPFQMPWLTVAGLVVAIPLIAGVAAAAASTVAQRFRPVQMSTLAVD